MKQPNIAIAGQSLTSYAVAAALSKLGYNCTLIYDPQKPQLDGPSLVLNDVCETLLRELFGAIEFEQIGQPLSYRWVRWGPGAESERVPQPAWVISSAALLKQIRESEIMQSVAIADESKISHQELSRDYAWTVYRSQPPSAIALSENFDIWSGGERVMVTAKTLNHGMTRQDSCYIESLPDSWLFYAPFDEQSGMLQACLPIFPANPRKALLETLYCSKLISPLVAKLDQVRCFPSAPRLQLPLYGDRWLRFGVKLDPISGEGTPFALRTGILAAAVIDGILKNTAIADDLLNHYQNRLTHSFLSHLQGCSQYYQLVFSNHELWQGEIHQMIQTAQNLLSRLEQQTNPNLDYQLIGFKLHSLAKK